MSDSAIPSTTGPDVALPPHLEDIPLFKSVPDIFFSLAPVPTQHRASSRIRFTAKIYVISLLRADVTETG
jgi:hypothetical protein